jgi:hypothetical protein
MKLKDIYHILIIGGFSISLWGCEETVWPEVTEIQKNEYLGIWTSEAYTTMTKYTRLTDEKTNDFYYEETVSTDSVKMTFQFGVVDAQNNLKADSVIVTRIQTVNGVEKAPAISRGRWTVAETTGGDYSKSTRYINIWNPQAAHGLIVLPFTTYTIKDPGSNKVTLEWQDYNNTAQNSTKYFTKVVKSN